MYMCMVSTLNQIWSWIITAKIKFKFNLIFIYDRLYINTLQKINRSIKNDLMMISKIFRLQPEPRSSWIFLRKQLKFCKNRDGLNYTFRYLRHKNCYLLLWRICGWLESRQFLLNTSQNLFELNFVLLTYVWRQYNVSVTIWCTENRNFIMNVSFNLIYTLNQEGKSMVLLHYDSI